jgi:hypothetical protein
MPLDENGIALGVVRVSGRMSWYAADSCQVRAR